MKVTKKKLLGLLGLFLVAAVTTFAALLPQTEANASHSSSITDQVEVRVVGSVPLVQFTSPANDTKFSRPKQSISFNYENVTAVDVLIEYTDREGNSHTYSLEAVQGADYQPGSKTYELNLDGDEIYDFGYGDYKVTARGHGYGAENIVEDVIVFHYMPFNAQLGGEGTDGKRPGSGPDNPLTGNVVVDPGVDPDDDYIDHLTICVRDEAGNPIEGMCPIDVDAPFDPVVLPFEDEGLPSGWYSVEIQAYDADGEALGEPQVLWFYYKATELPVPNTGAPFANLNISRQDYLLTGAIVFIAAAVLGIVFVVRRKSTAKRNRR